MSTSTATNETSLGARIIGGLGGTFRSIPVLVVLGLIWLYFYSQNSAYLSFNNITNLRQYVGRLGVLAFVLKTIWFYSFTRPSWQRLRLSADAANAARKGDFTGHRRFLA